MVNWTTTPPPIDKKPGSSDDTNITCVNDRSGWWFAGLHDECKHHEQQYYLITLRHLTLVHQILKTSYIIRHDPFMYRGWTSNLEKAEVCVGLKSVIGLREGGGSNNSEPLCEGEQSSCSQLSSTLPNTLKRIEPLIVHLLSSCLAPLMVPYWGVLWKAS